VPRQNWETLTPDQPSLT